MRLLIVFSLFCSGLLVAAQLPDLPDGTKRALQQIPTFRPPVGMKVELFAAEPMLASPVAIGLDEKNRVFAAEEYRIGAGAAENRSNPAFDFSFFLNDDLQTNTLEDRLKNYRKWEKKVPGGSFSYFTRNADRLRRLEDTNGDGKADKSTVFAGGFNKPLDGLAAGVLAHNGDIYFTCIPNLWRFRDTNGDGIADEKKALLTGFGVNIAFYGHDLHGLIMGPDGKLYFTVGDRGFNVTSQEGKQFVGPRTGAVFRCNPDGSDFEVVHRGLRNPQELAFDEHGNLFADDNNCDKGDFGRLVYVVEGGESGWNMAYQTIPPPYMTGPWFAERLWHLQHPGQAAYIVPPVGSIGTGPGGFLFTSGTSLADRYKNCFLMCNFTGNGGLEAFKVKPNGAGFEIQDYHDFFKPIRATDCEFGSDGKLYVSDFVDLDWNGKSLGGRVYTVFDPKKIESPVVKETKELFAKGFQTLPSEQLAKLLHHADQRVRLRAQFTLADRGAPSRELFATVLNERQDNLSTLHAIWGLGQLGRQLPIVAEDLLKQLDHPGAEVRAQAAKVLGDLKSPTAADKIVSLLQDSSARVKFFAAQSLGKLRYAAAVPALVDVLRTNANQDVYLRHGIVTALSRIEDKSAMASLVNDPSAAVRLAVVLVYRQWKDAKLAAFLDDADPLVRIEAARAIHDLPLEQLQGQLAAQLPKLTTNPVPEGDPLTLRAIDAAYRLGTKDQAEAVLAVATSSNFNESIRSEALSALKDWANPPPRDRVTGFWLPVAQRDGSSAKAVVEAGFQELLARTSGKLQTEALFLALALGVKADDTQFFNWAKDTKQEAGLRVAAMRFLAQRGAKQLTEVLGMGMLDPSPIIRAEARSLLVKKDFKRGLVALDAVLGNANAAISERQRALADLGTIKVPAAQKLLESWGKKLQQGEVPPELRLDLLEALKANGDPKLSAIQTSYEAKLPKDPVGKFQLSLTGGDAQRGRDIFVNHTGAQCIRCHKINEMGGVAGPELTKLASRYPEKTREYILESIAMPNAKIAPGYANVTLSLIDGRSIAGMVLEEDPKKLTLQTPEGKKVTILVEDIESRTKPTSGMPAADRTLNPVEMRDLIEYLATQK